MKNSQKGFIVPVLLVVIALLVIGGGVYVYKNKKVESTAVTDISTQQKTNPIQQQMDTQTSSITNTSMAGWKTYINTKNGYQLKYPADWQTEENLSVSIRIFNPLAQGKPDTDQPSEAFRLAFKQTPCKLSPWQVGFGLVNYKTACVAANPMIEIGMVAFSDQTKIIEDQILSTFKFTSTPTVTTNEQKVVATAREVIGSLSARDYQKLEGLVSSDGLSLNLYPQLDLVKNLIAKNDVSKIPNDTKIYLWGYTDGKGDPINLTGAQFLTTYIYSNSVDYLKAPDIAVNKTLGSGNSLNTIDKDVNGRTYVAFHFSGFDPKYSGMDWTTLYLVFDSVNGEYKLRGIAKANWTI